MPNRKLKRLPVQPAMCDTCPFRKGSKYAALAPDLAHSAIEERSRICHSTGANNAINHRTGKPPLLCRGARDVQLAFYAAFGVINEPTDQAWEEKCREMGI